MREFRFGRCVDTSFECGLGAVCGQVPLPVEGDVVKVRLVDVDGGGGSLPGGWGGKMESELACVLTILV